MSTSEGTADRNKANALLKPWAREAQEILDHFSVSPGKGLSDSQVKEARKKFGPNLLKKAERRSLWSILMNQVESLVVIILAAAGAVSFVLGHWLEGSAIVVALLINTVIGFFTELNAVRSMEALRELGKVKTTVRRKGEVVEIPAEKIVPSDIVLLESGDIVSADLRLVESSKLQADESTLTGESEAVTKSTSPVDEDSPLAERSSMLFKGTSITRGTGEGVVTATGMETEIGNITSLTQQAEEEKTPMEKRLDNMGHRLIWATLGVMAVVAVIGLLAGRNTVLMLETSVALAIAAIPEGLPVVATLSLARGVKKMARNNAVVNGLSSVETLGSTTFIFSDKTGTLTENRMTVEEILVASGKFQLDAESVDIDDLVREALKVGVLCNNASTEKESDRKSRGDPLELALLESGARFGISRKELVKSIPEEREVSFDPEIKLMATFHKDGENLLVAVKGAPEPVLEICSRVRTLQGCEELDRERVEKWLSDNEEMASRGLRVIALAEKHEASLEADPYKELTFLGLAGMLDPPRDDARRAIEDCGKAGIKVVMVTGDHPGTALNIGRRLGLASESSRVLNGGELKRISEDREGRKEDIIGIPVFARVSPAQKLDLIKMHQKAGQIVAMTGDGVNDAPALKKADIGVAMGKRGTQVAKEASDIILKDDSLSTIVVAVHQGRIIFNNIRKFIYYLLSSNAGKIMSVSLASLFRVPLPVKPLQILFLNLVTDVFLALALGVGGGEADIMDKPPRGSDEPVLTGGRWLGIAVYGFLIALTVLGALITGRSLLGMSPDEAVTFSFVTLGLASVFHALNMRGAGTGIFHNEIITRPHLWGAMAFCVLLLVAAVYLPGLSRALGTSPLSLKHWGLACAIGLLPFAGGQIIKGFSRLEPLGP